MADVTYTVQNKVGSYDGDMVIKEYTSMTINSGDTVTVDQPCRGLFIYVQGDCTIDGTLSMTAKVVCLIPPRLEALTVIRLERMVYDLVWLHQAEHNL